MAIPIHLETNPRNHVKHSFCWSLEDFSAHIADLTGIARKKFSSHLVTLIKVEGLFSPYIVTHFVIAVELEFLRSSSVLM